jgi:hypothetical protein
MTELWYDVVAGAVRVTQGDLILDCPVAAWKESFSAQPGDPSALVGGIEAVTVDVVVMSQACDLEHEKIANVILCPHRSLQDFKSGWEDAQRERGQNPTAKAWVRMFTDLREGYLWNLSLLNNGAVEGHSIDHRVVDFHEVFSVPRRFLEDFCRLQNQPRFRLRPPYREHLSQSFARFFMRVGLPMPISDPQAASS